MAYNVTVIAIFQGSDGFGRCEPIFVLSRNLTVGYFAPTVEGLAERKRIAEEMAKEAKCDVENLMHLLITDSTVPIYDINLEEAGVPR